MRMKNNFGLIINIFLISISFSQAPCILGEVYINEAANAGDDYIEVYNGGDEECTLAGFQLDDSEELVDFTFGNVILASFSSRLRISRLSFKFVHWVFERINYCQHDLRLGAAPKTSSKLHISFYDASGSVVSMSSFSARPLFFGGAREGARDGRREGGRGKGEGLGSKQSW